MAVRFIIGRAGSGKTHHCLEAIRRRLQEDPIDGPRLILLVPEQASLQMERALLQPARRRTAAEPVFGAHRAEVLSFRRLAHRILDVAGGPERRTLSEPARAMVLRHLVTSHGARLRYYRRVAQSGRARGTRAGFLDRLAGTIAELLEEAIAPQELERLADDPARGSTATPVNEPAQRAKFHDLKLIYQAYLDYLGSDKLDPSQYLQAARDALPRCQWLTGAEVWVDGFASLSGQETLTLIALARQARRLEVTVLMDPSLTSPPPRDRESVRAARLFTRPGRTYFDLRDRLIRAGVEIEEPLRCRDDPLPRFRTSPALARLERLLFAPRTPVPATVSHDRSRRAGTRVSVSAESRRPMSPASEGVELIELPSRRIEVDYAVSRVCQWVQDSSTRYRYRDMAIIARDLEPYHDLLSAALAARGIPFFIDRRRPVAHHPLVELLRAALAVAAERLSLESVRLLLKTGLAPVSTEAADELENYLLAHGLSGIDAWRGGDWAFPARDSFLDAGGSPSASPADGEPAGRDVEAMKRINAARRTLLADLDPWLSAAADAQTGALWSAAIRDWLARWQVSDTIRHWAVSAEADGDLDQAEQHQQSWRETEALLDDLAFALNDVPLTVSELADVMEAALSGLTLGLVPPTVDQVLVGSIERSRHPALKAAVILGFNDGLFPRRPPEDSILNDDDRARCEQAGLQLRPASRERVFEESMLAYVALTRASEAVVVTWAAADAQGRALRPSPYADALRAACPGLEMHVVADPIRSREMWDILSTGDVTTRLAAEFARRPCLARDDPTVRGRWNELYEAVRADLSADPAATRALAALDERDDETVSPMMIERLYQGPLRTSVSQLETFATCPFQHFARYTLRLRERVSASLKAVDVGQVHHAILEDFVSVLAARRERFDRLSDGALLDALRESSTRVAARLPADETLSDARRAYQLRRLSTDLARVIRAQRRRARGGNTRPCAVELPFGFDAPGSLPGLALSTPAGRRVLLRGYIDRVDLAELSDELLGFVIDYKSTRDKRLDLSAVYHGLSLQLPAYLLALARGGRTLTGREIRPAGALYVSLESRYHAVDHPARGSPRDLALMGTYRPRGLLLAETISALTPSATTGWSDHYSFYRKKDGTLGYGDDSDAVDAASFQAIVDHTREMLGRLADGVLDGRVSANPYRLKSFSPCSWCAMAGVCRFEMGICDVRFLESLKRSEVLRQLTSRNAHA